MMSAAKRLKKGTARQRLPRQNTPADLARRLVKLEQVTQIRGQVLDALSEHLAELTSSVFTLNAATKALDKGARETVVLLASQLIALRDLLIQKGVITAEEGAAVAQIADLERMLGQPWDAPKAPDSDAPGGAAR
jgi:hypothetical protein